MIEEYGSSGSGSGPKIASGSATLVKIHNNILPGGGWIIGVLQPRRRPAVDRLHSSPGGEGWTDLPVPAGDRFPRLDLPTPHPPAGGWTDLPVPAGDSFPRLDLPTPHPPAAGWADLPLPAGDRFPRLDHPTPHPPAEDELTCLYQLGTGFLI